MPKENTGYGSVPPQLYLPSRAPAVAPPADRTLSSLQYDRSCVYSLIDRNTDPDRVNSTGTTGTWFGSYCSAGCAAAGRDPGPNTSDGRRSIQSHVANDATITSLLAAAA